MRISDWSSDVCSSDLSKSKSKEQQTGEQQQQHTIQYKQQHNGAHIFQCEQATAVDRRSSNCQSLAEWNASHLFIACNIEIGRASCRERCVSTCRSRVST